jgi:hypothetical protein
MIFRTVGNEEEQASGGEPFDQAIQESLSLAVDPVEVLGDQKGGLDLALPDQQAFDGVQKPMATLRGIEGLPGGILEWYIQQGEQGWQAGLKGLAQRVECAGDLVTACCHIIAVGDLEVGFEHLDDRKIGSRLAIRIRTGLEDLPAVSWMRADELITQARLPHPGLPDNPYHLPSPLPHLSQEVV